MKKGKILSLDHGNIKTKTYKTLNYLESEGQNNIVRSSFYNEISHEKNDADIQGGMLKEDENEPMMRYLHDLWHRIRVGETVISADTIAGKIVFVQVICKEENELFQNRNKTKSKD